MVVGDKLAAREQGDFNGATGPERDEPKNEVLELAELSEPVVFVRDLEFAEEGDFGSGGFDAIGNDVPALRTSHYHRFSPGRDQDAVALDDRVEDTGQPGDVGAVELAAAGVAEVVALFAHGLLDKCPAPRVFFFRDGDAAVDPGDVGGDNFFEDVIAHFFFFPPMACSTPSSNGSVRMGVTQPSGLSE